MKRINPIFVEMNRLIFILTCLACASHLSAQYDHQPVFPLLEGDELRELVIDQFRPLNVLSYGQARDTMYGIIYNVNDSIAGIYSDHKVYLEPGVDPTSGVFMNGEPNGINAEHSYPQSKGAGSGNPRSDMHHLFPSRVATNSARGSLPFGEINDAITETWYYKTEETPIDPNLDIRDKYSERTQNFWEPREEVKGNIARAIFYFYTMYQAQADDADSEFFAAQKDVLCDWHFQDPVDQLEWERSFMIAKWQDDKANPFVLDCSLASRLYCPEISAECQLVDVEEVELEDSFTLLGNPFQDDLIIEGAFAQKEILEVGLYSIIGIELLNPRFIIEGKRLKISVEHLNPGTYFISLTYRQSGQVKTAVLKGIKTNK